MRSRRDSNKRWESLKKKRCAQEEIPIRDGIAQEEEVRSRRDESLKKKRCKIPIGIVKEEEMESFSIRIKEQ